jgi:folate-binding protein YgfZ
MSTDPFIVHLRSLGAVMAEGGVVLRYGPADQPDAHTEYEALRESWAVAELGQRCLVSVQGRDRQPLLQGILSQDVGALRPGQGRRGALLETRGQIVALLRILDCGEEYLLEMVRSRAALVLARLQHYRVAAKATFSVRDDRLLAAMGPSAAQALAAYGPVPEGMESHGPMTIAGVDVRVARAADLPNGYMIYVAPDHATAVWQALTGRGARPAGRQSLDAARVEDGIPWQEADIVEGNLLHEVGLVDALHSSHKGCYVGQEVVARLEARGGHVSRRLSRLQLTSVVPAGTRLQRDSQAAGLLTTCALSPRLGPCALGYVHRNWLEPGSVLEAGGERATVMAPD